MVSEWVGVNIVVELFVRTMLSEGVRKRHPEFNERQVRFRETRGFLR